MDTAEIDKLKWQANFFKQRVEALEAELAVQADPAPASAPVAAPIESDDAGEELARLRWRNRFLEGRLAYFEGDSAVAEEASAEAAELVDLTVDADEAPEDEDDVMSATDAILQELEEADAAADAEEEDAFLEEMTRLNRMRKLMTRTTTRMTRSPMMRTPMGTTKRPLNPTMPMKMMKTH